MEKLKALTRHPRFALHAFYAFTVLLIVVLLIFSSVSGPGTRYYWLKITLNADSKTRVAGEEWSLGGLGSCSGDVCAGAPHASKVRGCLIWHLAAAGLFLTSAMIQSVLVLQPPKWDEILLARLTLLLPPAAFLPLAVVVIIDFAVRAGIGGSDDVASVETQASFWLSTAAMIIGVIWVIVALWVMSRERKKRREAAKAAEEEAKTEKRRERKREKELGWMARLNPWRAT